MGKFVNFLINSVKEADYFGEAIKLQFDKNKKFNTLLGGFLSIIIYVLSLALIISLGETLINRDKPMANSVTLFKEYAPRINISDMDLRFGFGFFLDKFGRFDDSRYFNYAVTKGIVDRSEGGYKKIVKNVPIEYCKDVPDRFINGDKYNYTDQAQINDVGGLYCFKYNNETMEGAYVMNYFENIKIGVTRCKNKTTSKVICKSDAEIDDALAGGTFQVFFTNRYIDVIDFKNPMKEYFPNWFIKIDPFSARFVDLYYKMVNITSDVGYIFEDKQTTSYAMYDYAREQFDTKESNINIIKLYINSSNNFMDISRSYMKFTDLAATVGGILSVCLVIGRIISRHFSAFQMKLKMLNTLYYFDSKEEDAFTNLNIKESTNTTPNMTSTVLTSSNMKRSSWLKEGFQKTVNVFAEGKNDITKNNQNKKIELEISNIDKKNEDQINVIKFKGKQECNYY